MVQENAQANCVVAPLIFNNSLSSDLKQSIPSIILQHRVYKTLFTTKLSLSIYIYNITYTLILSNNKLTMKLHYLRIIIHCKILISFIKQIRFCIHTKKHPLIYVEFCLWLPLLLLLLKIEKKKIDPTFFICKFNLLLLYDVPILLIKFYMIIFTFYVKYIGQTS